MTRSIRLIAAALTSLLSCATAWSQTPCPTDPGDDVIFEVTIEYFDTDAFLFGQDRDNFQTFGPALGGFTAPFRDEGDLNADRFNIQTLASASGTGGSLSFNIFSLTEMRARRDDGNQLGNGATVIVKTYVKGPTGTPYFVNETSTGTVDVSVPTSAGRFDACFNGVCADKSSGPQLVDGFLTHTGMSGAERSFDPDGDGTLTVYSLARTSEFDAWTGFWQSIDFCFPSCNFNRYTSVVQVSGFVDAGIGQPPCGGSLTVKRSAPLVIDDSTLGCSDCKTLVAPWEVEADFAGDCSCCEYRQYVRVLARERFRAYRVPGIGDFGFRLPMPSAPNHEDESKIGPCLVEDTSDHGNDSNCSAGYIANGERAEPGIEPRQPRDNSCRRAPQFDLYLLSDNASDEDRLEGCFYRGRDEPSLGHITPGTPYKLSMLFEAVIIAAGRDGCLGANADDQIVARRRFSICYEGVMDISGPTICTEEPLTQWPDWEHRAISIAGFEAEVYVWTDQGYILATLAIPANSPSELQDGEVSLTAPGAVSFDPVDGGGLTFAEELGTERAMIYKDLALAPVECSDANLSLSAEVLGDRVDLDIDLSRLLDGCGCRADLTGSADPNDPTYGQPDGVADSSDFFFYLDGFVTGDLAVCDLTGSSDPNDPTFDAPDGDCDADDFFRYLDLFVAGCP
ncbi:MAG: GC-type dockerin domain-anchored protein [Phycisphaerales bacterium JB037]